jgi:ATP-dependent RNA helicase HelY
MTGSGDRLAAWDFALDPFQLRAIEAIDAGRSVLVAAPTGSGKTVVAEHAVAKALAEGGKAFYTAPIKALSNQKFGDLARRHGPERVGLLTGDNAVNGDAPVVVMTTEVLRNMIYAGSPALAGLRYVVLDEVHYLQDAYRGPVWEEVILHLPPEVKLVCLSATVSNAEELAEWITTVRGPTDAVIETTRPVELVNLYCVGDKGSPELHLLPTLVDGYPNAEAGRLDAESLRASGRSPAAAGRPRRRYFTPRRPEVIDRLDDENLLPAIYFIFSRAACDDAVRACVGWGMRLTDADEAARIRAVAQRRCESLSGRDRLALGYDSWLAGLELGFAAHHAGMVPAFKETAEECFGAGLVKVVFATETLALGINMPARSVVIEKLSKFNGDHHEFLTPGSYTQLTGRAGRRGLDPVGYAVVLWSPFVPFDQVATLASSRSFRLTSAFRPTYNMAANLVRRYEPAEAHHLLNLSFAQYQADAGVVKLEARLEQRLASLARAEEEATCERGSVPELARLRADDRSARRRSGPCGN